MKRKIVTIDGWSSCGKSTLAKQMAKVLGYVYIDSGAMYRAITLYFLRNSIDFTDKKMFFLILVIAAFIGGILIYTRLKSLNQIVKDKTGSA